MQTTTTIGTSISNNGSGYLTLRTMSKTTLGIGYSNTTHTAEVHAGEISQLVYEYRRKHAKARMELGIQQGIVVETTWNALFPLQLRMSLGIAYTYANGIHLILK